MTSIPLALAVISESTGVAIGLVAVFLGLAFGAGRWMAVISQQLAHLVKDVQEMVSVGKATQHRIEEHDHRLTELEYSVGIRGHRDSKTDDKQG